MEKIVKCRKQHNCDCCSNVIEKGQYATFLEIKTPRFADDHETQIGIKYYKCWLHVDPSLCDKFLNGATVKLREGCPECGSDDLYLYEPVNICWECKHVWETTE